MSVTLDNEQIEGIAELLHDCVNALDEDNPSDREVRRLLRADLRDWARDLLTLARESGGECASARILELEAAQQRHLELIRKLTQTTPLDSEVATALEQRGALLAEVGTLRARVAELEDFVTAARCVESFKKQVAGKTTPPPLPSSFGGACGSCGSEHSTDPPPFVPDDIVIIRDPDSALVGKQGRVIEWSVYGGPMYVRVEVKPPEVQKLTRENFDPCQLQLVVEAP